MSVDPRCAQVDLGLRRRGVLILATFGLAWAMLGSTGSADAVTGRVEFAVVAAVILAVAVRALRTSWLPRSTRRRRLVEDWPRRFAQVVAVEAVGIAAAVALCLGAGASQAIPAAVCAVVGAHFVPLARVFDQPQYRVTGWLMLLVAAAGLVATAAGSVRTAGTTVGFGSAIILCGTALHVLVRG